MYELSIPGLGVLKSSIRHFIIWAVLGVGDLFDKELN